MGFSEALIPTELEIPDDCHSRELPIFTSQQCAVLQRSLCFTLNSEWLILKVLTVRQLERRGGQWVPQKGGGRPVSQVVGESQMDALGLFHQLPKCI